MKVVLAGGSGQIGAILKRQFKARGDTVVNLSRGPAQADTVHWDGSSLGEWVSQIDGADIVVNLAGRSVNCRYNERNQNEMLKSRVDSTRAVGEAISKAGRPPRLWLQASTATIYAHRFDAPNDEETGIIGGSEPDAPPKWRFSTNIAKQWEHALESANTPHTRKVALRSAMTMSPDKDGIFDVLMKLTRRGLGGTAGDGRQYVSWIHEADFIAALFHIIDRDHLSGPINLSSPEPLPNKEFMQTLRQCAGVRIGLPAPAWLLEIGAVFMRTETELLLKSRRVVPTRLLRDGSRFQFSNWNTACADLAERWKALQK